MLERLDIRPVEAAFIDDNAENVEAARSLGIHSIHFRSTEQTISELDSLLFEHCKQL
jgi:FMN phosphatase YigB (HAD superfamily)